MSFDFSAYSRIDIPEGRVKQIVRASDGTILWKGRYINEVPISIDTDGSVYEDVGYIEGYRLSSSGALKVQADTVTTGFIPAKQNSVIRMSGVEWGKDVTSGDYYNYIVFYDADFNLLATVNRYRKDNENGVSNTHQTYVDKAASSILTDENGITTFNIVFKTTIDCHYIRISATGNGANMIVTVDEEITT